MQWASDCVPAFKGPVCTSGHVHICVGVRYSLPLQIPSPPSSVPPGSLTWEHIHQAPGWLLVGFSQWEVQPADQRAEAAQLGSSPISLWMQWLRSNLSATVAVEQCSDLITGHGHSLPCPSRLRAHPGSPILLAPKCTTLAFQCPFSLPSPL